MIDGIPVLNRSIDSISVFFDKLKVGDLFSFDSKDFLEETVKKMAEEQGKIVLFSSPGLKIYEVFGEFIGIVIMNIADISQKVSDVYTIKTSKELANCYKRIEELEVQIGVRGSERLEKCEFCQQPLYPYQGWLSTDSGGSAHSECLLKNQMEKLHILIKKKEDVVKKWTTESQKLASEAHTLRVENAALNEKFITIVSTSETIRKLLNEKEEQCNNYSKQSNQLISQQSTLLENIDKIRSLNNFYVQLFIKIIDILKRMKRLLGGEEKDEFSPLPQVKMPGELRVEIRGWCKPVYDDVGELLLEIGLIIKEQKGI